MHSVTPFSSLLWPPWPNARPPTAGTLPVMRSISWKCAECGDWGELSSSKSPRWIWIFMDVHLQSLQASSKHTTLCTVYHWNALKCSQVLPQYQWLHDQLENQHSEHEVWWIQVGTNMKSWEVLQKCLDSKKICGDPRKYIFQLSFGDDIQFWVGWCSIRTIPTQGCPFSIHASVITWMARGAIPCVSPDLGNRGAIPGQDPWNEQIQNMDKAWVSGVQFGKNIVVWLVFPSSASKSVVTKWENPAGWQENLQPWRFLAGKIINWWICSLPGCRRACVYERLLTITIQQRMCSMCSLSPVYCWRFFCPGVFVYLRLSSESVSRGFPLMCCCGWMRFLLLCSCLFDYCSVLGCCKWHLFLWTWALGLAVALQ